MVRRLDGHVDCVSCLQFDEDVLYVGSHAVHLDLLWPGAVCSSKRLEALHVASDLQKLCTAQYSNTTFNLKWFCGQFFFKPGQASTSSYGGSQPADQYTTPLILLGYTETHGLLAIVL